MEEWRRLRGPDNLDCRHCSVTDSKQEVSDSNDFFLSFSQNRFSPQRYHFYRKSFLTEGFDISIFLFTDLKIASKRWASSNRQQSAPRKLMRRPMPPGRPCPPRLTWMIISIWTPPAVPSLKMTVFYHPKPSLEYYREESKPDLSNKRVVRTIGKTEKKNTVVCFFALRVSFCGNWGWRGGSKIHALLFFSFF